MVQTCNLENSWEETGGQTKHMSLTISYYKVQFLT